MADLRRDPQPCQERAGRAAAVWRRVRLAVTAANRERLLWAVRVRWLAIGGFSVLAVAAWSAGVLPSLAASAVAGLGSAALNVVNHWCVRRGRGLRAVTALAIPLDVVLITYLIARTGGTQSPFVMLYVVQVVATAMLVDLLIAALAAVASAAGFLAALWQWPQAAGLVVPAGGRYQAIWGVFLLYCLGLLTYLGGYIAARLRRSEDDLAERNARLTATLASLASAHADLQQTVQRLRATEAQLVHSEKMRALGQFVAGIAHELNNPIGIVLGNLEYLGRAVEVLDAVLTTSAGPLPAVAGHPPSLDVEGLRADLPSVLADCEEGARRAAEIVGALGAFARADRPDTWTWIDLHERLDRTLALARPRLGGARIERHYGALPPVPCRAGELDQVWLNLLANAADAVRGQGTIAVHTTVACLAGTDGAPCAVVSVSDDGPGMPAEVRARVFEPFFTTKPEGAGTGLGLSVSYAIVERHGGHIALDSARGGTGTTVTVYLPLRPPPSMGAVAAPPRRG